MSDYEWSDWSNDELSTEKDVNEISQPNECTRELAQTQTVLIISENSGMSSDNEFENDKMKIGDELLVEMSRNIEVQEEVSVAPTPPKTLESNEIRNKNMQSQNELSSENSLSELLMANKFTNEIQLEQNELIITNNVSKVSMFEEGTSNEAPTHCEGFHNVEIMSTKNSMPTTLVEIMESQDESSSQNLLSTMDIINETSQNESKVELAQMQTIFSDADNCEISGATIITDNGVQIRDELTVENYVSEITEVQETPSVGNASPTISGPDEVEKKNMQNMNEPSFENNVTEMPTTKEFSNGIQLDNDKLSSKTNVPKMPMSEKGINDHAQKQCEILQNLCEMSIEDNLSHTPGEIIESQGESACQDTVSKMSMPGFENTKHTVQHEMLSIPNELNDLTKPSIDEMPSQTIVNTVNNIEDKCLETPTVSTKMHSGIDQTATSIPVHKPIKLKEQSSESIIATSSRLRRRTRKKRKVQQTPGSKSKLRVLRIQKDKKATKARRQPNKNRGQTSKPKNTSNTKYEVGGQKIQKGPHVTKTKHLSKRKRRQTSKKYGIRDKPSYAASITSSSDDDTPLANIKLRKVFLSEEQFEDSDKDKTFKPSAKDNNSTDTEYSSNLSDMEKHDRNINKKLFEEFKTYKLNGRKENEGKGIHHQKKKHSQQYQKDNKLNRTKSDKAQKGKSAENESKAQDTREHRLPQQQSEQKQTQGKLLQLLESVKTKSRNEAEKQNAIQQAHLQRLDQLLFSNGMKRVRVKSYGNCFFEAAAYSLENISASYLRESICKHLDENMEEYIGFLLQHGSPEDELEFVSQYCAEIQQLKADGYWSSKAGDFLPLALSNWSKRRVNIYTSKENQPTITIHPTVRTETYTQTIPLAYTAIPGIVEHYDACRQLTLLDPMSSDQGVIDYIPCNKTVDSDDISTPSAETEQSSVAENVVPDANTEATSSNLTNETERVLEDHDILTDAGSRDYSLIQEHPVDDVEKWYTAEPLYPTKGTEEEPQSSKVNTPEKDQSIQPTSYQNLTPRKAAKFVSPIKKNLTRKRKATPQTWKKNVRKQLRISGQEYTSPHSGKKVSKRMLKPPCGNCKFKCTSVFTEEDRQNIFDSFWSLGAYERQKDFICSSVEEKKTRTYLQESNEQKEKKRMVSRSYSLETGGRKSTVCKIFFRATLDIGETYINHALKQKSEGRFQGVDNRGRHCPANKTPLERLNKVRQHIESFPAIEAHYTRKDSNRKFLGPELNITKMYEEYSDDREKAGEPKVTPSLYRKIFNEEYNYSFHVPKKDQCNLCTKYNRSVADGSITHELKEQYQTHQARKETARKEKEQDKQLAKTHSNIYAATFDLQAVLYTPCSIVSLMYYMRKFCYYNFTVFSLATLSGTCYVWTEVEAKRGSCEIATCLNLHLQSLSPPTNHVILYSDACGGQNRNQVIATCFLEAVETMPSINIIDHKFLESGHTQMECDSMHSAVEHAKKHTAIYTPYQWDTVLRQARRRNPYVVVPIRHGDVKDFKKVKQDRQKNVKLTTDGKKVQWNKIKWMRYLKTEPGTCYIKYDFGEEFQEVKVYGTKRGRSAEAESVKGIGIPRKYKNKLPISAAKKKDLMQMCKTGVIPPEFHDFYEKLPSSSSAPDKLGEPDALENESGNDTEED